MKCKIVKKCIIYKCEVLLRPDATVDATTSTPYCAAVVCIVEWNRGGRDAVTGALPKRP